MAGFPKINTRGRANGHDELMTARVTSVRIRPGPREDDAMARRLLVAFIALCTLLAGCGGDSESDAATAGEPAAVAPEDTAPPTPAHTAAPAPQEPPAQPPPPTPTPAQPSVPEVLAFTAATVDGSSFDGASLAGKNAVLWFWAPWCTVCARGAGAVTKAAAELRDSVTFVGVAGLSGSVADMQEFVQRTRTDSMTHLADTDGALYTRFKVTKQDAFAFISPDGRVELVDAYSNDIDLVAEARQRFGL
jgi:peroxiredoxin